MTKDILTSEINTSKFIAPTFNSKADTKKRETREVVVKTHGIISLNTFAICQFIYGFALLTTEERQKYLYLISILAIYQAEAAQSELIDKVETNACMDLSRQEVESLKYFLELRLAHCEQHKLKEESFFNPNTYVGMKLLLCDLRDWLSVIVV